MKSATKVLMALIACISFGQAHAASQIVQSQLTLIVTNALFKI